MVTVHCKARLMINKGHLTYGFFIPLFVVFIVNQKSNCTFASCLAFNFNGDTSAYVFAVKSDL